jgi:UDP-N-acetyl-D-glucosamine dehydrogenase
MHKDLLLRKLNDKTAVIGIVGLGYVGLPLSLRYSEIGYRVVGFDIDQSKVDVLSRGGTYIEHIAAEGIARAIRSGFEPTVDLSRARDVDALILCVPTPLNKYREPDLSYVLNTVEALLPHLRSGQIISLESTTYPGTTEEELKPRIENSGFKVGEDIFLVFSPEREDPGNAKFSTHNIRRSVAEARRPVFRPVSRSTAK